MVGKRRVKKIVLICLSVGLLEGVIVCGVNKLTQPDAIEHKKESVYSPMLAGPSVQINFEHFLYVDPWYHYFGTDLREGEVIASLQKQNPMQDILFLQGENGAPGRYLFRIGEKAPYAYQELYVIPEPFFGKAKQSYLLYDGCMLVKSGEEELQILFPFGILDYSWERFMETAGPLPQEDNIWTLRQNLSEIDGKLLDFLTAFYEESLLYQVVSVEENTLEVKIDGSSISPDRLNPNEWRRLEHICKKTFKILLNEHKGTVQIIL